MSERGRGRPRSEASRSAVLAAARDLLSEHGYEGLSVEQIAGRAGVGKQTIYRWWNSKAAVVADAVLDGVIALPELTIPDTGEIQTDLEDWFRSTTMTLTQPEGQAIIRALAVAVASDPVASSALYARVTGPDQVAVVARLRSAQQLGQIRADADLQGASDALTSFALFLVLARQMVTNERVTGLLRVVLTGITPH